MSESKSEEPKRLAEWHDDPKFHTFKLYMSSERRELYINCFNPKNPGQNSFPVLTQEFKR